MAIRCTQNAASLEAILIFVLVRILTSFFSSSVLLVVCCIWCVHWSLSVFVQLRRSTGYLEQARTLTASGLEGRAYFNLHNRPAFLQIDPIRLADAGDYRCRVDFQKARTVNTVISLKVIVPPEEPVITDLDGNELKGLVGPFNEGDELRLLCTTNGGECRSSFSSLLVVTYEYIHI